jgi:hypothetical protein
VIGDISALDNAYLWRRAVALYYGAMAQDTSTIRVPRPVRDSLARSARDRGLSVAGLIAQLAERLERDAILRSERDATLKDAESAAVSSEERDWERALGDGLD